MQQQVVSTNAEDPLSTRPVFLFALWMGILVIVMGIDGGVEKHTWSNTPEGNFSKFSLLENSSRNESSYTEASRLGVPILKEKQVIETTVGPSELEQEIRSLVSGYPIEAMAPAIAKQDRTVAALLVGIAKKESDWGRRVPTKNGRDCYNYWGYKGAGSLGTGMGYGCFASPEEAVAMVGGRVYELAIERNNKTPKDMIIWKCGSRSCVGHDPASVTKWIRDVDIYYSRLIAVK